MTFSFVLSCRGRRELPLKIIKEEHTLQAKYVRSPAIRILVTSINFSGVNWLRLVN